ncbi:MAG: response regulator [Proteobacteria bacterium]|nr:response regulator [Pseudomonadota bacterium]
MADGSPSNLIDIRVSPSLRHDLRTPLNHIIGYSEMLAEEASNSGREDLLPDLQRINQAAREMVDQVDGMFAQASGTHLREPGKTEFQSAPSLGALDHKIPPSLPLPPQTDGVEARPGKILVVDDNEFNRDMLSRWLQRRGYATALAENGRVALEKLVGEPFDLVLLDLMMPEMDGHETLARIKADGQLRNIPVIMISAQTELESIVRCIEMGAEDYLPKPFNPVLLWARVGSSLEKKRLREQDQEHREQTLRSEAALERLGALAQMVAGVAHEINTPLGIASTALSIIDGRLSSPKIKALFGGSDETRELLEDMVDSSALLKSNVLRAHKLVDTFKKISVGQITENKEKANLPNLVADAVDLFRINARQAKLSITIDVSGIRGGQDWLGYPGYLIQVVMNFLQNVERYAYPDGKGGKVEITVGDREQDADVQFVIVVRDYGKGISAENLPKVFDPFFTTGRGRGGTGLGLSIVKNIVNSALKGDISVTSEPGQGTVFTLAFPKIIPS